VVGKVALEHLGSGQSREGQESVSPAWVDILSRHDGGEGLFMCSWNSGLRK